MKTYPRLAWGILFLVLVMAVLGYWAAKPLGLLSTWAIAAFLMLVALGITGLSLGRGATGILIDPLTNTMSLSRLQIVLWTWVILSAFITLGMARVGDARNNATAYQCPAPAEGEEATCADPLGIKLPPLLWALMGISLTSAVGAPLLKVAKAQRTTDQEQANRDRALAANRNENTAATFGTTLELRKTRQARAGVDLSGTQAVGALVKRDSPSQAAFSDVITGEEVATFGYVDIAKVQNLFFSVIAVVTYAVALAGVMLTKNVASLFAFPDPTPGLVALIGISHGGYLVDKAATHSVPEAEKQEI